MDWYIIHVHILQLLQDTLKKKDQLISGDGNAKLEFFFFLFVCIHSVWNSWSKDKTRNEYGFPLFCMRIDMVNGEVLIVNRGISLVW